MPATWILEKQPLVPYSWSGHYGEEKSLLPLLGIEPQLLGGPAHSLVTILTEISRFSKLKIIHLQTLWYIVICIYSMNICTTLLNCKLCISVIIAHKIHSQFLLGFQCSFSKLSVQLHWLSHELYILHDFYATWFPSLWGVIYKQDHHSGLLGSLTLYIIQYSKRMNEHSILEISTVSILRSGVGETYSVWFIWQN